MKLWFYRGATPNFGDEINTFIWPLVLGAGFFDDDESQLFLGTGSIIFDSHPRNALKIVAGAGFAGYTARPDVTGDDWDVHFVRGPRTAATLGLPASTAIADSAILIRTLDLPRQDRGTRPAFMPHMDSLRRGNWREACALADIDFIDPSSPVERVLSQIGQAGVVLTEAMHGAIVADALRVPWIAVLPIHPQHRIKWLDWAEALDIQLERHLPKPSSARELWTRVTGRDSRHPLPNLLFGGPWTRPVDRMLVQKAAERLSALANATPQMSDDRVIARATERAVEAVENIRTRYGAT